VSVREIAIKLFELRNDFDTSVDIICSCASDLTYLCTSTVVPPPNVEVEIWPNPGIFYPQGQHSELVQKRFSM